MKIGGSFARKARFEAPTCLVSILWFYSAVAVSMGEAAKPLLAEGFKTGCISFCVPGVTLCDIITCFMTCKKRFCGAGALLLQRFQKMRCISRGNPSIFETSDVILRGRHSTFDVSCCVFFPNRNVKAARSGDAHHSTLFTSHSTLYTPDFTLYTLYSTLYALHSAVCTPHFALFTSHFMLYNA